MVSLQCCQWLILWPSQVCRQDYSLWIREDDYDDASLTIMVIRGSARAKHFWSSRSRIWCLKLSAISIVDEIPSSRHCLFARRTRSGIRMKYATPHSREATLLIGNYRADEHHSLWPLFQLEGSIMPIVFISSYVMLIIFMYGVLLWRRTTRGIYEGHALSLSFESSTFALSSTWNPHSWARSHHGEIEPGSQRTFERAQSGITVWSVPFH